MPGAAAIYRAQKDAFRGAAKAFGDGRASKIFPGKLLRRGDQSAAFNLSGRRLLSTRAH